MSENQGHPRSIATTVAPLWIDVNGEPRLQGVRCDDCRVTAFPAASGCIVCGSVHLAVVPLASQGTVEAFTRVGEQIVCEVRLDGGPMVLGWVDAGTIGVGAAVRFEPRRQELRFVADG